MKHRGITSHSWTPIAFGAVAFIALIVLLLAAFG